MRGLEPPAWESQTPRSTNWATPSYFLEEAWGVDPHTFRYRPFSRRGCRPLQLDFLIVVPQGFEPRFRGPKPRVLPIRRGNIIRPICQRTFSFELRIGIEPISPDYKSGASPSMLTKQYKIKNPNFFWVRVLHSFLFFVNLYQLINENALTSERSVL